VVCSMIFFTLYFLFRSLYGPIVGVLSSFLIIFSVRDHLTYIWGQWGTAISFAYIPLVLLFYYKYSCSIIDKKDKPIYAYLLTLLLVFQFLFHALGFFIAGAIMLIYSILVFIKEKKLPFKLPHVGICIIIFVALIILFAPLQINQIISRLFIGTSSLADTETPGFFARLIGWYNFPGGNHGVPDFYFSFSNIYNELWMLPLTIIGLLYLALNRRRKDILILSTIIAFYVITHLDLVGILLGAKYPRIFYYESIMLYPIAAIGVVGLTSFIKLKNKDTVKKIIVAIFVVIVLLTSAKPTYDFFNNAYDGLGRLNDIEMNGIEWINSNVHGGSYLALIGAPSFKPQTWTQALAPESVIVFDENALLPINNKDVNRTTHVILDYSFLYMINRQDIINSIGEWEKNNTKQENLLYDDNGLYKVYKLE